MRISARAIVIKDDQLLVMDRNKFGQLYKSLPGGAVEIGETPEQAVRRELLEETTIAIANLRIVINEDSGEIFGIQYIFKGDYVSGEPKLDPSSEEYTINAGGKNLYNPMWLKLDELEDSNLLPKELKGLLLKFIKDGFPDNPINLQIAKDSKL